jgi:hypothetical protein
MRTWLALALCAVAVPASAQVLSDSQQNAQLRVGLDAGVLLGFAPAANYENPALIGASLRGRVGVQLSDVWSISYQGTFAAGRYTNCESCVGDAIYFAHSSGALFEVTLADVVQVGAGPSIFLGTREDRFQWGLGLASRMALAFDVDPDPHVRQGFSLGLASDLAYYADTRSVGVTLAITAGYELY